jgi:hypothetical protein
MKSFFKKTVISMFVLSMAGTAVAGHQNSNASYGTWAPHYTGFFIGVEGLDLRPMNGDTDYVTQNPFTTTGSFYNDSVSSNYQWGWRVYGGIKFTDNDDLTISWMNLHADDSDSVTNPSAGQTMVPRWNTSSDAWQSVQGKVNTQYTDVYAMLGHSIHFNNPWSVRFAGGLEWTKINSDLTVTGTNTDSDVDGSGFDSDSHLRGFGPRVEFDMTYHLPYNFALFAETNAGLLVSSRKISLEAINPVTNITLNQSSYFSTRHVVVPKFGTRLGASYTWIFGQAGGEGACLSALKIDAGWQVESYVHAIGHVDARAGAGTPTDTTFPLTKTSNFGDQGLFIGLEYSSGAI